MNPEHLEASCGFHYATKLKGKLNAIRDSKATLTDMESLVADAYNTALL